MNDGAWQLAMQQLLRQVIADSYFHADKKQFQKQLDGMLADTIKAISDVQYPNVDPAAASITKERAAEITKKVVGSIKPA